MTTLLYFVRHLRGHDDRLLALTTGRIDLAHGSVQRIVAGLQPLDRIELRGCHVDCAASLVLALRRGIAEAEADGCGWRVFDANGVLRCKKLPDDVAVIHPLGAEDAVRWAPLVGPNETAACRALEAAGAAMQGVALPAGRTFDARVVPYSSTLAISNDRQGNHDARQ